jgi:putative ABC transport system permease protein
MGGQAIAVTAVLASGIAMYVTMRASYNSLLQARREFYSEYRFADVFAHVKRAPETLARSIASIPGVGAVQTRVVMNVPLDIPGLEEPATAMVVSIPDLQRPLLNDVFLRSGRYPEPGERGEALISEAFAAANRLSVGDRVGAVMNGRWEQLRIAGVALSPEYLYEVRSGEIFPDNRRYGVMWMSRNAMEGVLDMKGAFNDVALTLVQGAREADVIERLDRLLERYGSLGAYGRADQISARFIADELVELQTMGLILPALFLAIVAFLLHIVMSRLVSTERGQIAVLRAFGYGRGAIAFHYLKLAVLMALPGAAGGIALGLWIANAFTGLYARYFHFPSLRLTIDERMLLFAVAIGAGAACLGAISAARKAVALAPAEAMRPESPQHFRRGVLERSGIAALLAPATRMIARNMARRPGKTLASALGIALAVSILVVGRYSIDSVDYIVKLQFGELQREDVTVTFQEQRPAAARYALAKLPGVLRVEPFRQAPARLRLGHRSRRVAITGISAQSALRPLLDRELRPITLPPEGIVLNRYLGELLGAKPGDPLEIEILEGARPIRSLAIAAFADEPVGLGAYMDARALHRLLREPATISGAYVSVDPQHAEQLYSLLKRTPPVSGVSVKQAAVDSFWKSYGETIWISTTMLVGFAAVIAFGIVYNGARIALSERGHELASLRVLGYTKGEIARILLGEQSILTALAIPAGLVLGYGFAVVTSQAISRDLFRLPLVIGPVSYLYAALIVVTSAAFSGFVAVRRLARMDLTSVLKSRE